MSVNINSWLEDELRQQYRLDRSAVDDSWRHVFETNGGNGAAAPTSASSPAPAAPAAGHGPEPPADAQLQPLRGVAARIAENMAASVAIPLATSQRTIAVK